MTSAYISLIILLAAVVLLVINKFPESMIALGACCALVVTGVLDVSDAFSGFSDSSTILLFSFMLFGVAFEKSGLLVIAGNAISRMSKDRYKLSFALYFLLMYLVSGFLNNTTSYIILSPVLMTLVSRQSSLTSADRKKYAFLGVMAVQCGGLLTLVGTAPNNAASSVMETLTGRSYSFFELTKFSVIFIIALFAAIIAIVPFIGRRLDQKAPETDNNGKTDISTADTDKYDKKNIRILVTIFAIVFIGLITENAHGISRSVVCMSGAVIYVMHGCIPVKEFFKGIKWNQLILFGGMLGVSKGIVESGAGKMIADRLMSIFTANPNPVLIIIVFTVVTAMAAQVISASAWLRLILPIVFEITAITGGNFMTVTVALSLATSVVVLLPTANGSSMMAMQIADFSFRDFLKFSVPASIVGLALSVILPILVYGL